MSSLILIQMSEKKSKMIKAKIKIEIKAVIKPLNLSIRFIFLLYNVGGVSRNTAGSWMELFVTKFNGWKPLSFVTTSFV